MMLRLTSPILLLLLGILLQSCPKAESLPEDPGIAGDDFGIGLTLRMQVDEATDRETESELLDVSVMSFDDVATEDPYSRQHEGKDIVLALYPDTGGSGREISELRIYRFANEPSGIKLLGESLKDIHTGKMLELLGSPASQTAANDGNTHSTYFFAAPDRGEQTIQLVLSHSPEDKIFALKITLQDQSPIS